MDPRYFSTFEAATFLISLLQAISNTFIQLGVEPYPYLDGDECRADRGKAAYDVVFGRSERSPHNAALVLERINALPGAQHKLVYLCNEAGVPSAEVYAHISNIPEVLAATNAASAKILKGQVPIAAALR